jgi:hypothetical protein
MSEQAQNVGHNHILMQVNESSNILYPTQDSSLTYSIN